MIFGTAEVRSFWEVIGYEDVVPTVEEHKLRISRCLVNPFQALEPDTSVYERNDPSPCFDSLGDGSTRCESVQKLKA